MNMKNPAYRAGLADYDPPSAAGEAERIVRRIKRANRKARRSVPHSLGYTSSRRHSLFYYGLEDGGAVWICAAWGCLYEEMAQ